jgi:hypothetical protein
MYQDDAFHLCDKGDLKRATQLGGRWVFTVRVVTLQVTDAIMKAEKDGGKV